MLLAALAVAVLGIFCLAEGSIPLVWLSAAALGQGLGWLAGRLTGRPLSIGSSFGGIDYLVLMTVLAAGWLASTPPPRRARAIGVAAAILLGHLAYLVLLACCPKIVAALPDVVPPPADDKSHLGLWAWGNAVRTLLPWNLPAVALLIHATIAGVMFRRGPWIAVMRRAAEDVVKEAEAMSSAGVGVRCLAAFRARRAGRVVAHCYSAGIGPVGPQGPHHRGLRRPRARLVLSAIRPPDSPRGSRLRHVAGVGRGPWRATAALGRIVPARSGRGGRAAVVDAPGGRISFSRTTRAGVEFRPRRRLAAGGGRPADAARRDAENPRSPAGADGHVAGRRRGSSGGQKLGRGLPGHAATGSGRRRCPAKRLRPGSARHAPRRLARQPRVDRPLGMEQPRRRFAACRGRCPGQPGTGRPTARGQRPSRRSRR